MLITITNPRSQAAEAYRTLRTNLMFSNVDAAMRTFALVSASNEDDKSVTLANLAVTLAQAEFKTLIVDADLRRPAQHKLWNTGNETGLTNMILDASAFDAPPIHDTEIEGLGVLASGVLPPNPADVLASKRMDDVIRRLADMAEYVLFDLPPVLAASDASVFCRKIDGVLLIASAGHTRRDHLTQAKDQLERVQVNVLGAVLTNAPKDRAGHYG